MKPQPGDIQALKSSLHTEPTLEGNLFYLYEIISPFQKHLARVKQPFIASWFPRSFFKNQKQAPSPNPGTAKPEKTNGHSLRQGLWLQLELGLKGAGNPKVGENNAGSYLSFLFSLSGTAAGAGATGFSSDTLSPPFDSFLARW